MCYHINMKTIFIVGLPGTGKTTLSKKLVDILNFNYINDYEILYDIDVEIESDRLILSKLYSKNLLTFAERNENNFVIDCNYSLLPNEFVKFDKKENFIYIVLGFAKLQKEKLFYQFRRKDKVTSDDELMGRIEYYLEISEVVKNQCKNLNITYFEISENRDEELEKVFNYLKERV